MLFIALAAPSIGCTTHVFLSQPMREAYELGVVQAPADDVAGGLERAPARSPADLQYFTSTRIVLEREVDSHDASLAHGRIVVGGARQATATERSPERWAALVETRGHGLADALPLNRQEEADEALLMGMRLAEGLDLDRLAALTGLAPRASAIADLTDCGLLERRPGNRIAATAAGRIVLDQVVLRLSSALEAQGISAVG